MKIRAWGIIIAMLMLLDPSALRAGDVFPIFDGHTYNGKFYPRVDIIEWSDNPGDPTYMDFHIYSKKNPLDLTFQIEVSPNKKVMLVNYFFPDRNEHQCRRVLAPGHFTEGYFVYKDGSDPDYDSIVISMNEMPAKKGRMLVSKPDKYLACAADEPERLPAAAPPTPPAAPATGAGPDDQKRTKGDAGAIKGKGQAVPFDF